MTHGQERRSKWVNKRKGQWTDPLSYLQTDAVWVSERQTGRDACNQLNEQALNSHTHEAWPWQHRITEFPSRRAP